MDRQAWTEFDQGCEIDARTADALMSSSGVGRRMARRPAEDSNREGHRLQGSVQGQALDVQVGGPAQEKIEAPDPIAAWVQKFGLIGHAIEAHSQAQAHGLALWVYGVDDGRRSDEPLDIASVRTLMWLRTVSRENVSVLQWGMNPSEPRFELPTHYQVTFRRSGATAVLHWSRVWAWDGVDIGTDQRALNSDGGGGSVFDLSWRSLKNYGVSHGLAIEALSRLSQAVWQNDNLARAVDGGNAGAAAAQYERVAHGGGAFGDYVTGAGENYSVIGRPIGGMDGVMKVFESALVADSPMPELVLLGAVPSSTGLGSEADGQIRSWYDYLRGKDQPEDFTPAYLHFYALASRALNGPTGGVPILDLAIGWPKLWQETPAEAAATRKLNAESRAIDTGGAPLISVAEGRTDATVEEEYKLAPEGVATVVDPEVAIEDIEIADDGLMPAGETPIGLKAAAALIGKKSPGAARNFIAARNVPLFRPHGSYAVFASHIESAMRESQVI